MMSQATKAATMKSDLDSMIANFNNQESSIKNAVNSGCGLLDTYFWEKDGTTVPQAWKDNIQNVFGLSGDIQQLQVNAVQLNLLASQVNSFVV